MALTVFESAARHENFSRAADELNLTESAISRQISSLENYLDVLLFVRAKKQVRLSDAGTAYINKIGKHLADLEMHTLEVMTYKGAGNLLNLGVIPAFANRWLLPRLQAFRIKHPEIILNLFERPNPFSFIDSNIDAALSFDDPSWKDVVKVSLFEEELIPVLSPHLVDPVSLKKPTDLLTLPIIHKASRLEAWNRWFELAGVANVEIIPSMHFDLYNMIIEGARAGLGVGLVPIFYVQDEIRRGDLITPFEVTLKHQKKYCFIYPESKRQSPPVLAFLEWLVDAERQFVGNVRPV